MSGIVANVTQILADPSSQVPGLGASGAIAGLLAAFVVLYPSAHVRTLVFIGPFFTITRLASVAGCSRACWSHWWQT
jgi:membrane associated rhomboid family serine protease